jgi:hypothetical protein
MNLFNRATLLLSAFLAGIIPVKADGPQNEN